MELSKINKKRQLEKEIKWYAERLEELNLKGSSSKDIPKYRVEIRKLILELAKLDTNW